MELKPLFQNIAAAIREKDGSTGGIAASAFPERIRAIPAGGSGTEITHKKSVEVVARDKIQIGDTVYTIDGAYAPVIAGLDNTVRAITFSPDGSLLVVGGAFTGHAKVYSVNGTNVTYLSDIYADMGTTALSNSVLAATFSPDGSLLVLGGSFAGYAKLYSVSGTSVTYLSDIYADAGATALSGSVSAITFSPGGGILVLRGSFAGRAKVYSISGTSVTYLSDIYADAGTTALGGVINRTTFSPDGSLLVVGGGFTGRAKVYSVNGTTVTYLSDLYADTGTTALSSLVNSTTFSPDGSLLVVGGAFTGHAKVYSVNGTTVTYLSDIYADAGTTALSSSVPAATFSPDGSLLVLGGNFTGHAKVYSVSGTTVNYLSDLYADAETTALSSSVSAATFSPDGNLLMLRGSFTGLAKVYSVSGTVVTYLSDIYADAGTTALSGSISAAAFSLDGSLLILGGGLKFFAITYQVTAPSTVAYVPEEYAVAYSADQFKLGGPAWAYFGGGPASELAHVGCVGIGYADQAIEAGETGTVQVIFEVS